MGFLVFASAMFELQARSIVSNVRMFLGADVVALVLTTAGTDSQAGSNGTAPGYPLPQAEMAAFLDADRAKGGPVVGYTFISIPLTAIPVVRRASLTNLVNVPRLTNRLYGVQENFLDVAYREFAVVTESSSAGVDADTPGVSTSAASGGGGGSVAAFVRAQPVRALYEGAGALTLPLEATLPGPPQTLLSAAAASGSVGYVCAASAAAAASGGGSAAVDDGWLLRVPAAYMASPAQYAAFTHEGLVNVYAPDADSTDGSSSSDSGSDSSAAAAAAPSPAAVVSSRMTSSATDMRLPPSSSGSSVATFARAADYVRRSCNYDGSGCGGGSAAAAAAAAAGNGSSAAAAAAALLRGGQLLFADYDFCAASCADGFAYNRAAGGAGVDGRLLPPGSVWPSVSNGDWLWAPPGGDGSSSGGSWLPPCALINGSWAASALDAAYNSPAAWGGAAPLYLYDLGGPAPAASGVATNAARAAGFAGAASNGFNISSSASARALALSRALLGASACRLPPGAGCLPVSRASPFASADRVTNAYLRYIDVLQSEAMRGGSSLSTLTPLALRTQNRDPDSGFYLSRAYLAKCRAMVRKMPGFLFSSYSQTAFRSPVILRMRDAARLYADALIDYRSIVQSITGRGGNGNGGSGSSGGGSSSTLGNASAVVAQKRVFFPPVPLWFAPRSSWLAGTFPPSGGLPLTATPASGISSTTPPLLQAPAAALDADVGSVWVQPLSALSVASQTQEAELVVAVGAQAQVLGAPILPPLGDLLYPFVAIRGNSGDGSGSALVAVEAVCPSDNSAASGSASSGDLEEGGSVQSDTLAAAGCAAGAALARLPSASVNIIRSVAAAGAGAAGAMSSNNTIIMTMDLGSCGLVSGLRLSTNSSAIAAAVAAASAAAGTQLQPAQLVAVSLYALSDPSARGVERVASVVAPLQASIAPQSSSGGGGSEVTADFSATFTGFSARYWAVAVTSLYATGLPSSGVPAAAARAIVLPDVSLAVGRVAAVSGACQGSGLGASDAVPELAKHRLMVKLKDGATAMERQRVINGLRSYLRSAVVQIQDTNALVASTDVAVIGLNVFFIFVATLALVLAFFSVWLSFSSNVRENSTEFGILRSLGLPAAAVMRAYIYEALSVVLTAFGLGTAVGLLVASTLTLQFNLFTEMPFEFNFPTGLFVLTLLGSIVLAVVASFFPARAIARLDIAGVLKGRAA